jgi:integrase
MRKRTMTATQATATKAPKAGRAYTPDGEVPGLMVRTTPAGVRSYVMAYRFGGVRRLETLGRVGELSQADAREEARGIRRKVSRDEDPRAVKVEAIAAGLTLSGLLDRFITDREPNLAPKTLSEYRRMAQTRLGPAGGVLARDLRRADVKALVDAVARKRGPVAANRLFQLVRAALRWGVAEELLPVNPAAGLKRPRAEKGRDRWLHDDEVKALWKALDHGDDSPTHGEAALVRTLLLVGQRYTETLEMRWSNISTTPDGAASWEIPGKYRKGGRTHVVPLPQAVMEMLSALPRSADRVFPVSRHNEVRWWAPLRERTLALLRKDGASPEPFTLHDLRRTCATGCARLGASDGTVSRLLGHAVHPGVAVTAIYNRHSGLPELTSALNAWCAYVQRVVDGKAGANVLPMRGRA